MKGIPYMGSKRRIAPDLIRHMANANPEARHFVDLFGGGGAMSFAALESGFFDSVHYNELNPAIVALVRKLQTDGVTPDFYQWISRERFFELIEGSDWLAGLAQTCWSFGNNQKDYLYGPEREPVQKGLHEKVVALAPALGWQKARAEVVAQERAERERVDIEHLERLARIDIQHLEAIERLQHLEVTNHSYESAPITTPPESTIIYCDIPYQSTAEYREGDFNHAEFYRWAKASPYRIYISSYSAPDFECVLELNHRSTLSATANNAVIERLFTNRPETHMATLF